MHYINSVVAVACWSHIVIFTHILHKYDLLTFLFEFLGWYFLEPCCLVTSIVSIWLLLVGLFWVSLCFKPLCSTSTRCVISLHVSIFIFSLLPSQSLQHVLAYCLCTHLTSRDYTKASCTTHSCSNTFTPISCSTTTTTTCDLRKLSNTTIFALVASL